MRISWVSAGSILWDPPEVGWPAGSWAGSRDAELRQNSEFLLWLQSPVWSELSGHPPCTYIQSIIPKCSFKKKNPFPVSSSQFCPVFLVMLFFSLFFKKKLKHCSVLNACLNLLWFISDVCTLLWVIILKLWSFFFTPFVSGMGKDITVTKEGSKKCRAECLCTW